MNMPLKRTVMAIDDDEINLMILSKCAQDAGFSVLTFDNTLEGWDHMRTHPGEIDIVLLDKMMPEMTGIELLQKMKSDKDMQYVPVIMQTGDVGVAQMREGLESGAYYYLTKPFHPEILSALLNAAAHECEKREELLEQVRAGQGQSLALLDEGVFYIQNHKQAQELAALMAQESLYPEYAAVGLMELMANAIEHGNYNIGAQEKQKLIQNGNWEDTLDAKQRDPQSGSKRVRVELNRTPNSVDILIHDEGEGFDWQSHIPSQEELTTREDAKGRGICKAMVMLDNIHYADQGSTVICSMSTASLFN